MSDLPDPLDELASAILDGEATADEQARAGEAGVRERIAAFEGVARAVAEPVPPPNAAERDAAIAAAAAALTEAAAAPVTDLTARRAPARRWLPAAAAVLVLAGALGVLAATAGNDDDETPAATEFQATEEEADAQRAGDADESTAESDSSAHAPSTCLACGSAGATTGGGTIALSAFDLGAFATEDELVTATREALAIAEGENQDELSLDAGMRCEPGVDGAVVLARTATVAGEGLDVFVVESEGGRRLVALAPLADCALRYDEAL